ENESYDQQQKQQQRRRRRRSTDYFHSIAYLLDENFIINHLDILNDSIQQKNDIQKNITFAHNIDLNDEKMNKILLNPDSKILKSSNNYSDDDYGLLNEEHYFGHNDDDDLSDDLNLHIYHIFNILLIFFYSLLAIISLIGNGLVCRVLLKPKQSSYTLPITSSNGTGTSKLLIINLAISDLLLTTFNIPMNIVRFVSRDWPFGSLICTMMPFIQSVSAYCSAWTMMIIAFERYRKIFHPRTMFRLRNLYRNNHYNRKKIYNNNQKHRNINNNNNNINVNRNSNCTMIQTNFSENCIRYSVDSSIDLEKVEISTNTNRFCIHHQCHHNQQQQQQQILNRKFFPNFYQTIERIVLNLRYCFCAYFCCCCPIRWIPPPPPVINQSPSTTTTRQITKKSILLSSSSSTTSCSKHFSPTAIVLIIWIISLILSIPHSLFSKIVHHDYIEMTRCTINNFPNEKTKYWLTIYTFITQYILPIGITTFCYLHIGVFLWRRETIGLISERKRLLLLQRKRKRIRLLIMVVATFAICWLPLNLYILLTDLGFITHHHILLFFIVHWFAMSSVCYNPFIYCWLNELFRQKITSMLKYLFCNPCIIIAERLFCCYCCCFCCWCLRWCKPNTFNTIPTVSTVCDQIYMNKCRSTNNNNNNQQQQQISIENEWNFENELNQNPVSLASWSSTTNSGNTTGQQQAISELISMSAYLENNQQQQNSLNNQNIINSFVTKEQRLALMTTQAGRRRYHSGQLIMLLTRANAFHQTTTTTTISTTTTTTTTSSHQSKQNEIEIPEPEPITKTTSLNLNSFCSSSETDEINNSPNCDNV
ncbi:Serpentine type 7TM GPCR chemoreceptor Srsx, partial [Dermatophagoides pteronyssinus]